MGTTEWRGTDCGYCSRTQGKQRGERERGEGKPKSRAREGVEAERSENEAEWERKKQCGNGSLTKTGAGAKTRRRREVPARGPLMDRRSLIFIRILVDRVRASSAILRPVILERILETLLSISRFGDRQKIPQPRGRFSVSHAPLSRCISSATTGRTLVHVLQHIRDRKI